MLAGFRACWCLRNYFRLDRFGSCTACPRHGVKCSNDTLILLPGFYWSWKFNESGQSDDKVSYEFLTGNLAIESDSYDNKTMAYFGKVPKAYKCPRQESCLGGIDSKCAKGYAGPLCANCQSGFYKRMIVCHECPSKKLISIQFSVLALTIMIIMLVIVKSEKSAIPGRRTIADIFLAQVKIVIGFYQVLAGLLQAFSYVKWPSKISVLESYVRFVQLNVLQIVSPSCVEESFEMNAYSHFAFTLAGNVLFVVVPMSFYLARAIWVKMKGREDEGNLVNIKKPCLKITIFLLFVAYPSTCVNIFQMLPLSCNELCPFEGSSNCPTFLRADYTIKCDTNTFQKYAWAAYTSLTYVVGFPIFLAYIVWRNHHQSERKSKKFSVTDEGNSMKVMAFAVLFLHENYSPNCWYWESIEMVRKMILSAGVIFVGSESRTQIGIAAMVSGAFAMLHGRFRPITDRFEDYLQMLSLLVTSFTLGIGVLLKMPSDVESGNVDESHDNAGLGVLLLATNALVLSVVLGEIISYLAYTLNNRFYFRQYCCQTDELL